MIKAIVYTSNTGFTKRYAQMLGNEKGIPVYEFGKTKGNVNKEDEIIYMGWLMAGGIKNYKKAKNEYNVKAVCAIGMTRPSDRQYDEILKRHNIKENLFYLQGGFDKNKLKGLHKFMMNILEKVIRPNIEKKENKNEEDIEMLEIMQNGKDCVKKENLAELINWLDGM